jgi:hypothetical protein
MKKLNNIRTAWPWMGGLCFLLFALAPLAWGGEADDLQAMIDRARRNVTDLQRIDEQRVAAEDIAVLSTWLDEAWRLRAEKQYDTVRQVLDRCDAQADMIREQITAGQLAAQAQKEESALEASRKHVEELKQAIAAAKHKKAQLEIRSK